MLTEKTIREKSAKIIMPRDVETVDKEMIRSINKLRNKEHVIIDSHAVTKEEYGFRITPFSLTKLKQLRPTKIFMLYAKPSIIRSRIRANNQGRPLISADEANMHNLLQANVVLVYGIQLGVPIYLLDSNKSTSKIAKEIITGIS